MRALSLTLVSCIAIAAVPAFAQSSASSSETTTTSTSGVVPAPTETQTMTKSVTRSDDGSSPMAETHEHRSYERKTTTNGVNSSTETKASEHSAVDGADGSTSESRTTTTQTHSE